MASLPSKDENASRQSCSEHHVQGPEFVGEDTRDDSAEEGGRVEDRDEVGGELCRHAALDGVGGEVEERCEYS